MNYTSLFYLMNERYSLVEIKINGLPKDSPKEDVYKWFAIASESNKVEKLKFKSMSEEVINGNKMNVRKFENAELRFDNSFAKFVFEGDGHILENRSQELLPTELDELILKHLK
jgi:hypothetical protein